MTQRVFTMRKACKACRQWFTITSAASMFCKDQVCVKKRRKADREERKRWIVEALQAGDAAHLERALKSGD